MDSFNTGIVCGLLLFGGPLLVIGCTPGESYGPPPEPEDRYEVAAEHWAEERSLRVVKAVCVPFAEMRSRTYRRTDGAACDVVYTKGPATTQIDVVGLDCFEGAACEVRR